MLKKVRQALLYQNPNKHPNLDMEKAVLTSESPIDMESFHLRFDTADATSYLFGSRYEVMDALFELMQQHNWEKVYAFQDETKEWLNETGIKLAKAEEAQVAFSLCTAAVAKTGTLVFSMPDDQPNPFADIKNHVILATSDHVVDDLRSVAALLKDNKDAITFCLTGGQKERSAGDGRYFVFIINEL